jgi:hypothetical protein
MPYLASDRTMAMKRTMIGAIASIAVMGAVLVTYALISSVTISNTTGVNAVGVGVYSDSGCTIPLTSIPWGMLNPGDSVTHTIYVLNSGTVPVTLTMATSLWSPPAASGNFTVTWNQQNTSLGAGLSTPAVLTLNVSSGAPGIASVTFDITITGTH